MSKFILKMPVLARLSRVCDAGKIIRLEYLHNYLYGISTDETIACVEFLGESAHSDEKCELILTEELQTLINKYGDSDNEVVVETIPEVATGSLKCAGHVETSCFYWGESTFLDNWKHWLVPPASCSKGFMFWNVYQVQRLFEASPTGELVFPEFFDSSKPVLIRDINDSNWVGVFIPQADTKQIIKGANRPEWWPYD